MTIPGGLLYDPTKAAVPQLLGILAQNPAAGQPGQPAPAPVAPMQPQGSQSLLGKVHDFIQNHLAGSAPSEYTASGLLSPQDVQAEKPGILDVLAHKDAYRRNLDNLIQMRGLATQIAEAQRQRQARAAMPSLFPEQENETVDQTRQRLAKMYAYAMSNGLTEEMKDVGSRLSSIFAAPKEANPATGFKEIPGVGLVDIRNPDHPKVVMTAPAPQRNIDPLSPQGLAAQMQLATGKQGLKGGANLPAPMAAKVGQAGEMIKKASDLLPQMDALDVNVGNSAAQDIAAHGIGVGHLRVPGTQGLGSMMLNRSEPYSKYQASLSPFVLAAAHALSGARINQDQVEQIRQSIEYKPGDSQTVRAQKRKNMVDLVNSISGSLPAEAIASQEDQMDPTQLATLKSYGYRGAARGATAPAPAKKRTAAEILAAHGIK